MRKTGNLNIALVSFALLLLAPLSFAAKTGSASGGSSTITTQTITTTDFSDIACDSVSICPGTPFLDTIAVNCVDTSYAMKIVEGPGSLTTTIINLKLYGYYSYTPEVSGYVNVKFLVTHTHTTTLGTVTDSTYIRKKYYIHLNQPPAIGDIWAVSDGCDFGQERVFHPQATDPENDKLRFVKISGPGTVDSFTGEVRYTPTQPGSYQIYVAAFDKCGGDTACIHDSVSVNTPPYLITSDTTISICKPEKVCFDVHARDSESDSLSMWQVSGPGNFVRVSNTVGWTCFTPADVDSAVYMFIYCVVDSCSPYFGQQYCGQDCTTDTINVTVLRNKPPVLACQPMSFFTCVADTFCFPLPDYNDPEFGAVSWSILSGNASFSGDSLCVPVSGSGVYNISLAITDPCGASDTCIIPITVSADRPPVVVSADPFSISLCVPEEICFPVTADDPDFDIASVSVNIGSYDAALDRVCFTPTQSGVFEIITTATDSCGLSDADTTLVTVDLNQRPVVTCGNDTSLLLCGPQHVCVPFVITDANISNVFTSFGTWDAQDSRVCFTPETAGAYHITIIAIDDCGAADTASVTVTVTMPDPPVVTMDPERVLDICGPQRVCFPVTITGGYKSVITSHGTFDPLNSLVCFDVNESSDFYLTVTALDSCGNSSTDTMHVVITVNAPPQVAVQDTSVYQCVSGSICLPVSISDIDNNLDAIVVNRGQYANGAICFTPTSDGVHDIIIKVMDSCGASSVDTAYVTITSNKPPVVSMGEDINATSCGPSQVCVDADVLDDNLESVITNIGTWDPALSRICFAPDTAGRYFVRVIGIDSCGASDTASLFVNVTKLPTPTVSLGADMTANLCEPGQICIPVAITGSNLTVTTNFGTYNPQTGQVCFNAAESAELRLIVSATDSCGQSASDNMKISVHVNRAPVTMHMPDTSVYLCYPTYICLPLTATDPDGNLKSVTVNRGQYSNGQVCFVPYGAGTYEIIATATDSCGKQAVDTAVVVVTTDQFVKLIMPKDTTVFACDRDTFCFPIGGIPSNATVTVSGINTWYNPQTESVCFYVDCGVSNKITVTAKTPCNTFTGTFTVTVGCNRPPIVILPPDYSISVCGATTVCVPVGIADYDGNLQSVTVEGGTYDAGAKKVCFDASGAGVYTVTVIATDSCGVVDSDFINVTLTPNLAPIVSPAVFDTSLEICNPNDRQQICVPFAVSDPNGNLISVTSSRGTYNMNTGLLCFNVDPQILDYTIYLLATDACGLTDTSIATIHIVPGDFVNIQCPAVPFEPSAICKPGQVCVPLVIDGPNFTVTTSFGSFSNGQLCFNADTSGIYTSRVIANAECNADTCTVRVKVTILPTIEVFCPKDTSLFLCAADTICLPYTASTSATSISVTAPAYVSNGQVCVPILQSGNQVIKIIASGTCGADTCQFSVNATINTPPTVNAGRDTTLTVCQLGQVCIPFTYSDVNNNSVVITTSHGTVNGNTICFTPPNYGQFTITVTATDACGAQATDQVVLRMIQGESANITCPAQTQYFTICGPQTVCVDVPISPNGATLNITPANATYDWNTHKLCLPVSQTGNIQVTIIASSQCGADTCSFTVHTDRFDPPTVTSPASIDTTMCLATPDTLCFPVTITGTSPTVTVTPSGYYSAGYVCVPVSQTSTSTIQIITSNSCGADTSTTQVKVTADTPPVLHVPSDVTIEFCPGDTTKFCFDGIWATDTRSAVTITKTCGAGTYTSLRSDSGKVCFVPDTAGVYEFCYSATDGCQTVTGSFKVTANAKANCDVCVTLSIESGECTVVGVHKDVFLNIQTNERIGGFDLLLSFDASVMAFNAATIQNTDIQGWEYFTYRTNSAGCNNSCPSGLIRFVGIAETNNGAHHPPDSTLSPDGRLIRITFLVSNNQNLGDQFLPIHFVWYDCGDNSFSDPTGNYLYIDGRVFSPGGLLEWDEADNVNYPEASRPYGLGATDACATGGPKGTPLRCIDFIDGGICVIHPESIDARGDINLNEIAYEIADAVLFSNYFIYGLSVFKINIAGQIAASDVNADGLTLSVADLVHLIRVIVGDADPVPKLNPYAEPLALSSAKTETGMSIQSQSVSDIGAIHLVYRLNGDVSLNSVDGTMATAGMDVKWATDGSEVRILISDIGTDKVMAGEQHLIDIAYSGSGSLEFISCEAVDYQGQPYTVNAKTSGIPSTFALNQNYPNPFNPTTTISFALPTRSDWRMTIFSVTGAIVREFDGTAEAGTQTVVWDGRNASGMPAASGVYFYRLSAGQFSETRKMVLLK